MAKDSQIRQRLANLKERLKQENPVLSQVVDSFQELDYISRRLGSCDAYLLVAVDIHIGYLFIRQIHFYQPLPSISPAGYRQPGG
jgi:hypothetical protein